MPEHGYRFSIAWRQQQRERSPNKKSVCINGVRYESLREAERRLGISNQLIRYRLNQPTFPTYQWATDAHALTSEEEQAACPCEED